MKMTLAFALTIILPVSSCAEKKESRTASTNPEIFWAKIENPRHVAEIAVVTPDNRFLYLKQLDVDCPGVSFSDRNLTVDLTTAAGVEWIDGKPTVDYAFNKAGSYKLLTSDNLETELDNSYSRTFMILYSPSAEINTRRGSQRNLGCLVNGETIEFKHR